MASWGVKNQIRMKIGVMSGPPPKPVPAPSALSMKMMIAPMYSLGIGLYRDLCTQMSSLHSLGALQCGRRGLG
jgi:hypothetical protein